MRTRRISHWTAMPLLGLLVVPVTSAQASGPSPTVMVTTTDGEIVNAGDVIGVGQRSGDTCTFTSGTSVVMTMASGGVKTTMRIDDACRVFVDSIETVDGDSGYRIGWAVEPKHPGVVPAAMPLSGVSLLDRVAGAIARIKPPKPRPEPEPVKLWSGYVEQTFFNTAGLPQWQDRIELEYAQGVNSGQIATSSIGERTDCAVQTIDPTTTFANVKSNCVYQHTAMSGPYAELYGSGDYQQVLLGQVIAATTTKEVFIVTKTDYSGSCPLPGSAPTGWTFRCQSAREAAA